MCWRGIGLKFLPKLKTLFNQGPKTGVGEIYIHFYANEGDFIPPESQSQEIREYQTASSNRSSRGQDVDAIEWPSNTGRLEETLGSSPS